MSPLTLTLKSPPSQRLDMSALTPERLKGMGEREIGALDLSFGRVKAPLGDFFRIAPGDANEIRIADSVERLDNIGAGMTGGAILVEGEAGAYAGCGLAGGTLTIRGAAGPWAGAGMTGGRIEIGGQAGDFLGGALPGARMGMRGGVIVARGGCGSRAGDRMRRGLIVVEGRAGAYFGSRMLAGTMATLGGAEACPGYLMRRGTLVIDGAVAEMTPGFVDCGQQELVAMRLLAREAARIGSQKAAQRLAAPARRFAGDMAALGRGEILQLDG